MMVVLRNDGRLGFEVDFPNTRFVFMNYLGEGFYPEFQEERQWLTEMISNHLMSLFLEL